MDKRQFFNFGLRTVFAGFLGAVMGLKSAASPATYPVSAFRTQSVDEILMRLFETNDVGEDGSIKIHAPLEAEHPAFIPFRISAPGAEKIAVVVDNNTEPLVLAMDVTGNTSGVIMGTLRMQWSSRISCYAMKQGQLYRASRFVRLSESGYEA